jgi:tetratricopeptide (TPR) repeat protein
MRPDLRLCGVLMALALAPTCAHADWMSEYDRGLRALRAGDYAQAETHFRAAIREKREPVEKQRFQGSRYAPYVPQHHAAMAAWQRGDCAAALDYWQHAGLDAVLARLPELNAEHARGIAACGSTRAVAEVPAPMNTADPEPPAPTPRSEPVVAAATPAATAVAAPVEVAPAPATTRRPPPAAPAAAAARAPEALNTAIDAWLGGRYGELQRLEPAAATDAATRAQLLLLRAAARFVLAELDGRDAAALEAVRVDVRAAKAANAALSPDAGMFPPRFRTLWQGTR